MKPSINDITTDLNNPPSFDAIAKSRPSKDYSYPAQFSTKQRRYYVDLDGLNSDKAPSEVLPITVDLARMQERWQIIDVDPEQGRFEAVAITRLMRFRDDIVVEVRATENGSRIEMRSKSRLGKGDLGATAQRITDFLRALAARLAG